MPCTGSTINAATSPLLSSAASASVSPNGMPVLVTSGPKPVLNSSEPLTDSEPTVRPWKAWSQYSTRDRPVAYRANFSAASTASVPLFQK